MAGHFFPVDGERKREKRKRKGRKGREEEKKNISVGKKRGGDPWQNVANDSPCRFIPSMKISQLPGGTEGESTALGVVMEVRCSVRLFALSQLVDTVLSFSYAST